MVQLKKLTKNGVCPMCSGDISEHSSDFKCEIVDDADSIKDEHNVLPGKRKGARFGVGKYVGFDAICINKLRTLQVSR